FQAEDGIRDLIVTGVQTCALPILTLFVHALGRSATSIVAFLINAAKGTPAASFIGAPELLGALTDVSSFSSGRATIYCLVLVFRSEERRVGKECRSGCERVDRINR